MGRLPFCFNLNVGVKPCLKERDLLGVEQEGRLSTINTKKLKRNNHFYAVEAITKDERLRKFKSFVPSGVMSSKDSFKFDKSLSIVVD